MAKLIFDLKAHGGIGKVAEWWKPVAALSAFAQSGVARTTESGLVVFYCHDENACVAAVGDLKSRLARYWTERTVPNTAKAMLAYSRAKVAIEISALAADLNSEFLEAAKIEGLAENADKSLTVRNPLDGQSYTEVAHDCAEQSSES